MRMNDQQGEDGTAESRFGLRRLRRAATRTRRETALSIARRRLLWGFLALEGMREGEAMSLSWSALDLERGVVTLDENKTDDPRAWALGTAVVRALQAWKKQHLKALPEAKVFVDDTGEGLEERPAAELLRAHLRAAGVLRAELYVRSANRLPVRVHDLRATFVTSALVNGKTETWVMDRTGHRSSEMVNRYRRSARRAEELGLGELAPLDTAIPELAARVSSSSGGVSESSGGSRDSTCLGLGRKSRNRWFRRKDSNLRKRNQKPSFERSGAAWCREAPRSGDPSGTWRNSAARRVCDGRPRDGTRHRRREGRRGDGARILAAGLVEEARQTLTEFLRLGAERACVPGCGETSGAFCDSNQGSRS
jgi:hypothetical protein